ncbi:MAG: DUF167 domain-containing protein [Patescibacteria group bacterium]
MSVDLTVLGDRIHLELKAVPSASRTEIAGAQNGKLRVRIAAAPEDGKANAELCAFFAKTLGCPKKDVSLVRGEKSRIKVLCFPLSLEKPLRDMLKDIP